MSRLHKAAEFLKAHGAGEKSFQRALKRYFKDQAERIARAWENFPSSPENIATIFDQTREHEQLMPIVRRNVGGLMVRGALAELAELERRRAAQKAADDLDDFSDQELPQVTRDAIRAALDDLEAQPYWQDIQAETQARLTNIIAEGIDDKASSYSIGMLIREHLGGMPANRRAQKIARTETTMSLNAGHVAAMDDLVQVGLVTGKEWLAIADRDVRQDHAVLGGVIVPARGVFNVGGYDAPYPGHWALPAAQRINCRCTVVVALADDVAP